MNKTGLAGVTDMISTILTELKIMRSMTMRCITAIFSALLLLMSTTPGAASEPAREGHQSVGLVLSGGGAKGIAHIGVIKALEENDIPIDYITGTSMGSIVGGLYAAGYTPEEMLGLILSRPFSYWSTGRIDPRLTFLLTDEKTTPTSMSISLNLRRDTTTTKSAVPQSIISPLPMNFAFMDLFSAYTAQCGGNFDRLMVPFRCVASDVAAKHKKVLSSGSLGDAIRASMSFPAVFQPTEIDGSLLYDGGIYDNFPVDVMRQTFAPSIMIGVDVSTAETGPQTSIVDQLSNMIVQNNDYSLPADEGIKLRIDLNEFGLLDFPKARRIYEVGYRHAMAMMDSIKSRITTRSDSTERRLRRAVFKSQSPYLRFDSVKVTGATPNQNAYLKYLFTRKHHADTFGITKARDAYYRAISSGKIRDLALNAVYDDTTGLFDLNVKASVKDDFKAGFGGYITSSSNSYLFLSAGYSTLSFRSVGADINAWIGQSYMAAMANGRLLLATGIPSELRIEAVVSRRKFYENDKLFFEDKLPTFILDKQYYGNLRWSIAAGRHTKVDITAGYGRTESSFYRNNRLDSYIKGRSHYSRNAAAAGATFLLNTLNDINFPTTGAYYRAAFKAITSKARFTPNDAPAVKSDPEWLQLELQTRNYLDIGQHFSLGLESDIMISTRKLTESYDASILTATAYNPTPASNNSFNPAFRANSFIAAGIAPVYRYNDNISARLSLHGFLPYKKILGDTKSRPHYGKAFADPSFYGELDICYQFPFATLTGYCNYASYPARNWNVGISLGIYLLAPDFLR